MSESKKISSLSINGRITLNLHSLNNEGGEGNQILTRQVTIIDEKGNPTSVNAVSGDMLKHIQAEHLYKIASDEKLNLCSSCETFNANRITGCKTFTDSFNKDTPDKDVLDTLLQMCIIDDTEGILVTNNHKNVPRKSIAEFGWLIGLPEKNKTENFFHVKLVSDSGSETGDDSANQGQNIFHRPANSGIYAVVSNFDVARIGFNDIAKTYAIDNEQRKVRYKALLKSILHTFIKPAGAMRNTQNPHIVNFEGVISFSTSTIPAPTVSPLNSNYEEEIKTITTNLNQIESNSITTLNFASLSQFTEKLTKLINETEPFELKTK